MTDSQLPPPTPDDPPVVPQAEAVTPAPEAEAGVSRVAPLPPLTALAPAGTPTTVQPKHPLRLRRLAWASVAVLAIVAGVVGSLFVARQAARSDATKSRHSFATTATGISSTLDVAIQREEDLTTAASAFFAEHPKPSPAEFKGWVRRLHVLRHYPELQKLGFVSIVRETQLPEFQAQVSGRPLAEATLAGAATSAPSIHLIPPGKRGYYCLPAAGLARGPAKSPPTGLDYCAKSSALLVARDAGESLYAQVSVTGAQSLGIQTPVYSGPGAPANEADRVSSFVGWLTAVLSPKVVLAQALHGHSGNSVRLRYRSGSTDIVFADGTPARGAQHSSSGLHNGWSVESFGPAVPTAFLKDGHARELLIAGALASVLLGLLIFVLGAGRSGAPRPARAPRAPREPRSAKLAPVVHEDLYDALTGLPNRALLADRADRMLARASRDTGLLVGALVVDIDWFKDINEKLGQDAGDHVLKVVGERLEHVVRTHDSVGRMENDQFVILVEAAARGARLDALARRVIEALHKPVDLADFGPGFLITASIGVAFGRHETTDALLHDAYLALKAAKAAGKDRYTLFNANMRSVIAAESVLEAELNAALHDKQFFLLYQPIVELSSHKVVGLEALIRWVHPAKGVLAPADFIPLAEETGMVVPIGRWVLEEACSRAAAWNLNGEPVGISVMVSPNQLNRDGFATDVRRALQQSGLDASLLTLEIAETTVMHDIAAATERLNEIKQLGVRIAIDDFGSGYAYRSDLQRMPVDFLKVDRSSLAASDDEDYRSWLLEAILVFGRDLSLTVIAKGIETEEQVAALKTMGCSLAQGYFLGEPVPLNTVPTLLPAVPSLPAAASGSPAQAATPTAPATGAVASPPSAAQGPVITPDTSPSNLYH